MQDLGAVGMMVMARLTACVQKVPGNLQPLAGMQVTSLQGALS